MLEQLQHVNSTLSWIRRRDEAKERFCQADEAAAPDYVLIGELGATLKVVVKEGAQLALSEADYTSLAARHMSLVLETKKVSAALAQARAYEELAGQLTRLGELKESVGDWVRVEVDAPEE
jgi:hypothetical protein